jgi:hypothetical protein
MWNIACEHFPCCLWPAGAAEGQGRVHSCCVYFLQAFAGKSTSHPLALVIFSVTPQHHPHREGTEGTVRSNNFPEVHVCVAKQQFCWRKGYNLLVVSSFHSYTAVIQPNLSIFHMSYPQKTSICSHCPFPSPSGLSQPLTYVLSHTFAHTGHRM